MAAETDCELSQCSNAGSSAQEMAGICEEDEYDSDTLCDKALTEYVATTGVYSEETESSPVPPAKRPRTDRHV